MSSARPPQIAVALYDSEGPRSWCAVIRVPTIFSRIPGVMGGGTAEGPWVEGYGRCAETAIKDALLNLGRAALHLPLVEKT
jgi:hypothetical protein